MEGGCVWSAREGAADGGLGGLEDEADGAAAPGDVVARTARPSHTVAGEEVHRLGFQVVDRFTPLLFLEPARDLKAVNYETPF